MSDLNVSENIGIKVMIPSYLFSKDDEGFHRPITPEFLKEIKVYPLYNGGLNQNAEYIFLVSIPLLMDREERHRIITKVDTVRRLLK